MKHLILLLFVAVSGYFMWQYAEKKSKTALKRFTYRHSVAVLGIIAVVFGALLLMFYNRAISLL